MKVSSKFEPDEGILYRFGCRNDRFAISRIVAKTLEEIVRTAKSVFYDETDEHCIVIMNKRDQRMAFRPDVFEFEEGELEALKARKTKKRTKQSPEV